MKETQASGQKMTLVPKAFPMRLPAMVTERKVRKFKPRQLPKRIIAVALTEKTITIGKSFKVVDGVATLTKDKFHPTLGKKISENNHYVFFKPIAGGGAEAWPVALNSSNLKLYPVSHILHVKGVDADLRAQFKTEGMQEYYYHARLKFISLETSPSTVIKQYEALSARGFDVRLEVIKETPQSR